MTFADVFPQFIAGARIGRSDWLDPPKIKESYIFIETSPDQGVRAVVRYNGGNVGEYRASMKDIIADDWSVIV